MIDSDEWHSFTRFVPAVCHPLHGPGERIGKIIKVESPENRIPDIAQNSSAKGEKPVRKIPYRKDLLKTMASLFSLNPPRFTSRTDIESFAKRSYVFKTYLKGDDISIQYKDGIAILVGTVFDELHTLLAREILTSLPGVTGVTSKLEEHGEVPALNIDASLAAKVKSTFFSIRR